MPSPWPAIAGACALGVAAGLCTPRRRGPELLWDAVLETLRTTPAMAVLPVAAWWLAAPTDAWWPPVVFAFLPAWLQTAHGVRRNDGGAHRGFVLARDVLMGVAASFGLAGLLLAANALRGPLTLS